MSNIDSTDSAKFLPDPILYEPESIMKACFNITLRELILVKINVC